MESPAPTPRRPSANTHPEPHHPVFGGGWGSRTDQGQGGKGSDCTSDRGVGPIPHCLPFPGSEGMGMGGGGKPGRGRAGPGGRVFRFMGSVETTTPINAFFQSLRLQVSMSLKDLGAGRSKVMAIGGSPQHHFRCLLSLGEICNWLGTE